MHRNHENSRRVIADIRLRTPEYCTSILVLSLGALVVRPTCVPALPVHSGRAQQRVRASPNAAGRSSRFPEHADSHRQSTESAALCLARPPASHRTSHRTRPRSRRRSQPARPPVRQHARQRSSPPGHPPACPQSTFAVKASRAFQWGSFQARTTRAHHTPSGREKPIEAQRGAGWVSEAIVLELAYPDPAGLHDTQS